MSKIFKILEYLIPVLIWVFERLVNKVVEKREKKRQLKAIAEIKKQEEQLAKQAILQKELNKSIKDLARVRTQNAIKFGKDHR